MLHWCCILLRSSLRLRYRSNFGIYARWALICDSGTSENAGWIGQLEGDVWWSFGGLQWSSLVFIGLHWSSMVSNGLHWSSAIFIEHSIWTRLQGSESIHGGLRKKPWSSNQFRVKAFRFKCQRSRFLSGRTMAQIVKVSQRIAAENSSRE